MDELKGRKRRRGHIPWTETGSARADLQHIIQEHTAQFAQRGITAAQIRDAVMAAWTNSQNCGDHW